MTSPKAASPCCCSVRPDPTTSATTSARPSCTEISTAPSRPITIGRDPVCPQGHRPPCHPVAPGRAIWRSASASANSRRDPDIERAHRRLDGDADARIGLVVMNLLRHARQFPPDQQDVLGSEDEVPKRLLGAESSKDQPPSARAATPKKRAMKYGGRSRHDRDSPCPSGGNDGRRREAGGWIITTSDAGAPGASAQHGARVQAFRLVEGQAERGGGRNHCLTALEPVAEKGKSWVATLLQEAGEWAGPGPRRTVTTSRARTRALGLWTTKAKGAK